LATSITYADYIFSFPKSINITSNDNIKLLTPSDYCAIMAAHPYRTVRDVAIAIQKEGGIIHVALKLDALGSKRLGELRAQCIIPSRALTHPYGPIEYIFLKQKLPASKRSVVAETLATLASRQHSYELKIGRPFITKGTSRPIVSFDIQSPETLQIQEDLSRTLRDIPILQLIPRHNKFRPKFGVDSALAPEEAVQTLKKALEKYEAGIENVMGIGLALSKDYLFTPAQLKNPEKRPDLDPRTWEVFPFKGVGWCVPFSGKEAAQLSHQHICTPNIGTTKSALSSSWTKKLFSGLDRIPLSTVPRINITSRGRASNR